MPTKRVGLLGWPVEHSISPAMHNAAFAALNMDNWHYESLPTRPEDLEKRVNTLIEDGFVGVNVTIPHKQTIIELLDRMVLSARGVGAVNTVLVDDNQLVGHNTDSAGFILDLQAHGIQPHGQHALVLGAGGAAHAATLGLANRGATVTVMARREQAAWDLRNDVRHGVSRALNVNVQSISALPKVAPTVNLIINCTPVGMWPNVDESIWPSAVPFPDGGVVYDMVYRPRKTALMQQAETAGLKAVGGLGMLVQQGALAFELWTERSAPLDVMQAAADKALNGSLDDADSNT